MDKITAGLEPGADGREVQALQLGLRALLTREAIVGDEGMRRELTAAIRSEAGYFGDATAKTVTVVQEESGLNSTGVVDEDTATLLNALLKEHGLLTPGVDGQQDPPPAVTVAYTVNGQASSTRSPVAAGLGVVVIDRNLRGDVQLGRGVTDARGRFEVQFAQEALQGKDSPDLQVLVYSGKTQVGASEVRYNAGLSERFDVALTGEAGQLGDEHTILLAKVAALYDGPLRDLKESEGRSDISYLANKTGWDARTVAMAASADQLSQLSTDEGSAVPAPLYYALLRSGLPADPDALFRVDPTSAAAAWDAAVGSGVIEASRAERKAALATFRRLATDRSLELRIGPEEASLRDLISPVLRTEDEQRRFAELRASHRGDGQLWDQVSDVFGAKAAARLRLDGQLALLTGNNTNLIARLHATGDALTSPLDLVKAGFYRSKAWAPLVDRVPAGVPGTDEAELRSNYADLLAAQLRVTYPTQSFAEQIRAGELKVAAGAGTTKAVYAFLSEHQAEFVVGAQPIAQFVARRGIEVDAEVERAVTRLHRVHQLTTTDEAMSVLLDRGIDSAAGVLRYERAEFLEAFSDLLGGELQAGLTYAKSEQVAAATQAIVVEYLTSAQALQLGSGDTTVLQATSTLSSTTATDVIAMPTLEQLLGSSDYCSCDDCRSVLSPAAYLVDLFEFLDRPVETLAGKENPLDVLFERRPDLQHLQLSCENTNVALPYIDVVNEVLDHLVVNDVDIDGFTGHDTGEGTESEDLLASPSNVDEQASLRLKAARFPSPLPYDHALEGLRAHFDALELPLWEAMAAVRPGESLERPAPQLFGWLDILMERLGLSRDEYQLLTDGAISLRDLTGMKAGTTEAEVVAGLTEVKPFSRHFGVTYHELKGLLETRFVNPHAHLLGLLEPLGVDFATLTHVADGTLGRDQFESLLPGDLDASPFDGDVFAWLKAPANSARFLSIVLIADTGEGDPATLDGWELRRCDPASGSLTSIDLIRLLRFIRLWRSLGWSIAEVDSALAALTPSANLPTGTDPAADLQLLDEALVVALPRLGVAHLLADRLGLDVAKNLGALLSLWANLDDHGPVSPYAKLLLKPGPLGADPAFLPDAFGRHLAFPDSRILPHAEALRAAFTLTGEGFSAISTDLGYNDETPLTPTTVTALYRRGWLARVLKLGVSELLAMVSLTGVDPFAAPDIVAPGPNAEPGLPPLARLIDLVSRLKSTALKPVDAIYLLWGRDLTGRAASDPAVVRGVALRLRTAIEAVTSDLVVMTDPTGEIAKARMSLAYDPATAETFFGLLGGTAASLVPYDHDAEELGAEILAAGSLQGAGRFAYDDLRKRLSFGGVMLGTTRAALKAAAGATATFRAAVDALYEASRDSAASLFARFPELEPLHEAFVNSDSPLEVRRQELLTTFLPEIRRRRVRQQVLALLGAETSGDPTFATALLQDQLVLGSADGGEAIEDLTALERVGLSATYHWADDANGAVDLAVDSVAGISFRPGAAELPANGNAAGSPISAVWRGYLGAPTTGEFGFSIEADPGASVQLSIAGQSVPLSAGPIRTNTMPITLVAGELVAIEVRVEKVKSLAVLRWRSSGTGWDPVPPRFLFSDVLLARAEATYLRTSRAVALATALRLTPAELVTLTTLPDELIDGAGWLNALPATAEPDAQSCAALGRRLGSLLTYLELRNSQDLQDDSLARLLADPEGVTPAGGSLVEAVTGWAGQDVDAALARLSATRAGLSSLPTLARVAEVIASATRAGLPVSALLAAATNDVEVGTVDALQRALRARHDQQDWRGLLKPINDLLRERRRDAAVSHVLHRLGQDPVTAHIDSTERLFEFLLMDVGMQPVVETSRIRLALSSVQLFVERCLLNLVPRVSPKAIRARQWEGIRRMQLWRAQREIFLWPENWLDEELRDNQSERFKAAMGELLEGDITEDAAARTFQRYLLSLDEVAKLEPCGVYVEERDPGTSDDIVHLIGRSPGGTRKHFYRRREGGDWTPWEQVKLDIEDTPVIPVVWKGRTFLFWLKVTKEALVDPAQQSTTTNANNMAGMKMSDVQADMKDQGAKNSKVRVSAVLFWSEYISGKWTVAKTSDIEHPTLLGTWAAAGSAAFDRSSLKLYACETPDGLYVYSNYAGGFLLYTTHSLPVRREDLAAPVSWALPSPKVRHITIGGGTLSAAYVDYGSHNSEYRPIVNMRIGGHVIEPSHPLLAAWVAPFIVEDSRHVFYVRTSHQAVTISESTWHERPWIQVVPEKKPPLLIPDIVFTVPEHKLPDPIGPIELAALREQFTRLKPEVADIGVFVSEDAFIKAGLDSLATTAFDGVTFGMRGRVPGARGIGN